MGTVAARVMDPLYERLVVVVTLLFCAGLALLVFHLSQFHNSILEFMASLAAEMPAHVLAPWGSTLDTLTHLQQAARQQALTLAGLLAVLWVGGLGLVISKLRRISKELESRVSQRTAELRAANQDLEHQIRERTRMEAALRAAHEELERRVQERTAELRRVNGELCAEIAERRRAEEHMRQLNSDLRIRTAQLEAANKELEAFSYAVAHDLRAPLRGIDGFSQAVLEDYGERLDAAGHRYLERVREASQRMAALIDALLTLARLTRADLHREPVDLAVLAREVSQALTQSAPERHVTWVIQQELTTMADAVMARIVIENLLSNAWKFTGQVRAPRIEVSRLDGNSALPGDTPVFVVRDNGVGFDMAYADKLFQAFHRLHGIREYPGLGIGLATVHRILHRHGGMIWAEAGIGTG
ncbi:MAG: hypothetical protein D6704_01760, partial [Nitrospirae bacterium]